MSEKETPEYISEPVLSMTYRLDGSLVRIVAVVPRNYDNDRPVLVVYRAAGERGRELHTMTLPDWSRRAVKLFN